MRRIVILITSLALLGVGLHAAETGAPAKPPLRVGVSPSIRQVELTPVVAGTLPFGSIKNAQVVQ